MVRTFDVGISASKGYLPIPWAELLESLQIYAFFYV